MRLVVVVAMAGVASSALGQSFTLVGDPYPPGGGGSVMAGLSADGRTAAGYTIHNFSSALPGFRWNADSGRTDFGFESGLPEVTRSTGISGDGSTVVGFSRAAGADSPIVAFRWSGTGTFQSLGTMPGYANSEATGASHDGSVIAGHVSVSSGTAPRAFRWTQATGIQYIGSGFTQANAISRNGNVIVGEFDVNSGNNKGYFWTQATGMQPLASLNGSTGSFARGVSADGSFVVGLSFTSTGETPTLWHNNVPIDLGVPPGVFSINPLAVNDDASVIVGTFSEGAGTNAAIWTASTGFISLQDYLVANGVSIPAGLGLRSCVSVSADGRTFAGTTFGLDGGAFIATIATPCPADLDDDGSLSNGGTRDRAVTIDDLLYLLIAFEAGSMAADLDNGSNTGTRDNAVTIEDLLYFLGHFEEGC